MSSALYSLGRWAVGARRLVLVAWIGILVLAGGLAGLVGQGLDDEVTIPGTESQAALDRLAATFPQVSGASAQVVVVAPDGSTIEDDAVRGPVEDAVTALGDVDGVAAVTSPYDDTMPASVSDDDIATLMTVQLAEGQREVTDAPTDALGDGVDDLAAALPDGAQAALGGQLFSTEFPTLTVTEALGLLVALVVLVLTFGSFVAAGLPLLNAVVGVGGSMGVIVAATALAQISAPRPRLAGPGRRHPDDGPAIETLGVEPLDPAFTPEALGALMAARNQQVKGLLRDQSSIAGIGNAYSDDILHAARTSPFKLTRSFTPDEVARVHAAVGEVLGAGGPAASGTPAAERTDAKRAGMRVHGRTGLPCPVCGDTVREVSFADRSLQYCPTCQTGGQVLADRRMSRLLK